MIGQIATIFTVLVVLAAPLRATADESAAADRPDILVLRNGEILEGKISRQDDRYRVILTDGEIRLAARDVDFLCHSLQEAYDVQSRRIVGQQIEDRLRLASWCLRHNLTGPAAQELAAAMAIDPNDRRAAVLDRRLQEILNPSSPNHGPDAEVESTASNAPTPDSNATPKLPASSDDLERLARNLPRGTLESYSVTILPLLLNHCATAGCHSVGTQSKFVLLRPSSGSPTARRLTLRDLHNTLDWVDYDAPAQSKMLIAAKETHGTCAAPPIEKEDSREYQQLVAWVLLATQGDKHPAAATRPASVTARPAPKANPTPASKQADTSASSVRQADANPSPGGAGWANAFTPAGRTPTKVDADVKPATASVRPKSPAADKAKP